MSSDRDKGDFFQRMLYALTAKLQRAKHTRFEQFAGVIVNGQLPSTNIFSHDEIKEFASRPLNFRNKTTLLHKASELDNTAVLEYLLEYTDAVNIEDHEETTPIMIAFARLDFDKIKLLVEKGANLNRVDIDGHSSVDEIMLNDRVDILRYALDNGLNVNLCFNETEHRTLLHLACILGSLKFVCLLLEHGASVDVVDTYGQSPIHHAVIADHLDVVHYLISHGDDMNHPDMEEMTPLDYAREFKAIRVEEMLTKMNALSREDQWYDGQPISEQFDEES